MNSEPLLKVKEAILNNPEKFNMGSWKCGTTMCIGGWLAYLYPEQFKDDDSISKSAKSFIKLDYITRLFYVTRWPIKFHTAFIYARTNIAQAQIAADRIDHFIATDGKE